MDDQNYRDLESVLSTGRVPAGYSGQRLRIFDIGVRGKFLMISAFPILLRPQAPNQFL